MKLFTLFSLFALAFQPNVAQENCKFLADVVFVVDGSGSVTSNNFNMVKSAVATLMASLDIQFPNPTNEGVRIGWVTFSNNASKEITFATPFNNLAALQALINGVSFPNAFTNMIAGLQAGRDLFIDGLAGGNPGSRSMFQDDEIPRLLVLISDGIPNRPTGSSTAQLMAQVTAFANQLKAGTAPGLPHPVSIFSVHIGNNNLSFFQGLSSGTNFFLNFNNFGSFDPNTFAERICEGGMGIGDVHFTTHDGVVYTFNGAGDYIYMRNENVEIHVRDVYVGRATAMAAMAIEDKASKTVLEVWWDGASSERININLRKEGETNKLVTHKDNDGSSPFILYKLDEGSVKIAHRTFKEFFIVCKYGGRSSFFAHLPSDWETAGLAGNNNGKVDDDLCDRSGKCISLNATSREVHQVGLDWAVLPSELLFEKWMPIQDWEIRYHELSLNAEQLVNAKKVCGDVQVCIYDYISTGSEEYAKHTKNDYYSRMLDEGKLVYVGDRL